VVLQYPKVFKHIVWLLKVTWRIRLNYQNTTPIIFEHVAMYGNEHPAIAPGGGVGQEWMIEKNRDADWTDFKLGSE